MIGELVTRLRAWVGGDDGDGDDRDRDRDVDGSGEPYRDPAYNGRYEAEREVDRLVEAAEAVERASDRDQGGEN